MNSVAQIVGQRGALLPWAPQIVRKRADGPCCGALELPPIQQFAALLPEQCRVYIGQYVTPARAPARASRAPAPGLTGPLHLLPVSTWSAPAERHSLGASARTDTSVEAPAEAVLRVRLVHIAASAQALGQRRRSVPLPVRAELRGVHVQPIHQSLLLLALRRLDRGLLLLLFLLLLPLLAKPALQGAWAGL